MPTKMPNMNMKVLNKKAIDTIANAIPNNRKIGDYLMETLKIGRESAYRRIKNEIPLTFEEIVRVANDLNFSLDDLIERESGNRSSFEIADDTIEKNHDENFCNMLKHSIKAIEKILDAPSVSIMAAVIRLPFQYLPFKTLFKFEYSRYLYSIDAMPIMTQFSDVSISPQMNILHEKQADLFNQVNNITCIVDRHLYRRTIEEIQYFYRLNFFVENDLRNLQKELFELLATHDSLVRTGRNAIGSNYFVYHSFLELDANYVYYEYNDEAVTCIWPYPETSISVSINHVLSKVQKKCLESKIRNSTLLSKSNDLLRKESFMERYSQILEMI